MQRYAIGGQVYNENDPQLFPQTMKAYNQKMEVFCCCIEPRPRMYIARFEGRCIIKRMPNSGSQHAASCDSYVPPAELSGLGQVLGHAIQESPEEDATMLRLDFSLSKGGNRVAPAPGTTEHDSVKSDGNKLTLRGLLHYLWEEAGFNKWTPKMEGRRNWAVIRKYILQATEKKKTKGMDLGEILYMPEIFSSEHKLEISKRRLAHMMTIAASQKTVRRLMIVIAEVHAIQPARFGQKVLFKQAFDWPVMLSEEMHAKVERRFASELAIHNSNSDAHLIAIGTISMDAAFVPSFEEISLMITTPNWIPYEHQIDDLLIQSLIEDKRKFTKGLRYNLSSKEPLASVVLTDTPGHATAMYIIPPGAPAEYVKQVDELVEHSELASWIYRPPGEMPPIPPVAGDEE